MAKTVIGLFDSFGEAQQAVDDLMRFGVRREDISLVARDEHGSISNEHEVGGSAAAEGAGAGAVGGSLVGGALGLLVGTGLLVIPGIGPVLAAGPLAAGIGTLAAAAGATALGAGLGAAAGGLLGGLMGAGVPEDEAQAYVEGVRRGGTLLSVHAAEAEADDVREILIRNGAVDMGRRSDEWRTAGWNSVAADNGIDNRAEDLAIPRGDSYSIAGQQAAQDYQDSSKAGTLTGGTAGALTGAAIGAAGGPIGAVVGGIAGAVTGGSAGAAADTAGEKVANSPDRGYDFKDGDLNDVDRSVVDTSYTTVDRAGNRQKDTGFESGHPQTVSEPEQSYGEWLDEGERAFRTPENIQTGEGTERTGALHGASGAPYRADAYNAIEQREALGQEQTNLVSESGRRSPQYAGADQMAGAVSNMASGSGSDQPGREVSGGRRVRIYDSASSQSQSQSGMSQSQAEADATPLPAHGDFARGMRDEPAPAVEPDFARGMHQGAEPASAHQTQVLPGGDTEPVHGDFARGMREQEPGSLAPDYARGQRSFELHDADFVGHYNTMTGAGGQPYDYYKPGYQFGYELASAPGYSYDTWEQAERDARTSWERDSRNDWDQFKDAIRYGWEKARGRR